MVTDDDSPEDADREDGALHVASEGESWRFSLEDLENTEAIRPGSPEVEHVAFVVLGAVVTLAVVAQFLL